jgi:hypothetical protein
MKFAIMGAVIAATVITALPASAQVVLRADSNGVAVRERHNGYEQGRHRGYRNHRAECRTIKTRTVTPSGRVIVKTRTRC